MTDFFKSFGSEVTKLIGYIGLSVGVPIYMITAKYPIYETIENNPLSNRVAAGGLLISLLVAPLVLFIIRAKISSSPVTIQKKAFWGVSKAIWIFIAFMFVRWAGENIVFARDLLLYWGISVTVSFLIAPQFIIDYMQKK